MKKELAHQSKAIKHL
jgi:hypothetical protein